MRWWENLLSSGTTSLSYGCMEVRGVGLGSLLSGVGRGRLGTQVVTETGFLSVLPLSAALLTLEWLTL